ncbi:MAG: response regulator [Candidatus Omnitrophica bacterium]|nr:response regulator [Candidatus Omnitrophota bacterium]
MIKTWLRKLWPLKSSHAAVIKILIIEDSPVDANMIKKAVDICGFVALVAHDGRTGIEMARKHKPNLIILDYHLPDINGGQVLEELRASKETSSETVMVLTILNNPEVVLDSFMRGADQYFTKPISVSLLSKQIQVMLRHPHEG